MKISKILLLAVVVLSAYNANAQQLFQNIRGQVYDLDSQQPLVGVEIIIHNSDPLIGTTTDIDGNFALQNIPIGRVDLVVSYLGYQTQKLDNIVLNSAKETILQVEMEESLVQLEEIIISSEQNKDVLDQMSLLGNRAISPEETNRYAGGFNDPSRLAANFAGVANTADGGNDLIIKGNSPKYVQWRLEGMEITNPNHFGDQSAVGGSVSTLNNNMLANSDFATAAFSAEYGNVLSGIYNIKFRNGNNEKFESILGIGILGLDFTLEGPIKKDYNGSFLINYRYSTASIANNLGLIDPGGVPKFQDGSFKILLPTQNFGIFSITGLGGKSSFLWENVTPSTWVTPGDNFMRDDITEDYIKDAQLYNTVLNHTLPLGSNSYLKTTAGISSESIIDNISENVTKADSTINSRENFKGNLTKRAFRASTIFNQKISKHHKLQIGSRYSLLHYKIDQSQLRSESGDRVSLIALDKNIGLIGNFINWKYRINESVQFVTGIHNNNVLFNNKFTVEPRFAMQYSINNKNSFSLGLGLHSTMESIHNYFAQVESADGLLRTPNEDLDLLKARHLTLAFDTQLNDHLSAKVELYYQDLYDIPVENLDTSYYSTLNEGLEFRYVDLVNEGTGKNYGIELTIEKSFHNNYYYLFNASLFESKYTALDGIERNTQYNGNYLINFLIGKEFPNRGKHNRNTFGLNMKAFLGGGKKYIPLIRNLNNEVTVDQTAGQYYDFSKAYESDLGDIHRIVISASYKWNKPKTTHELFINLDNITNAKPRLGEYYDSEQENGIGYFESFGFFPNIMYRIYL